MSLGWKKFNFFDKEELQEQAVPEAAACSCSSGEQLFLGCSDGQVNPLQLTALQAPQAASVSPEA